MKKNWNFPKALLFDLDGVLIDSEPLHGKAWKETASLFDLNLTQNQLKQLRGRRRTDCAQELIKLISKTVQVEDFLSLHKPISRRLILSAKAMKGSGKLLKWCHNNKIPMALVTSSSSESLKVKTSHHHWMNLFSVKVLGDDKLLGKGKPAPDPFLLAAKKLNKAPEECWAVEDSISGVLSALNAGCYVLFLQKEKELIIEKKFEKNNKLRVIQELKELEKMLIDNQINKAY